MTPSGNHGRGWVGWPDVQVDRPTAATLNMYNLAVSATTGLRVTGGLLRPGYMTHLECVMIPGTSTGGLGVRRTLAPWAGLVAGMVSGKSLSWHQMETPWGVLGTKSAA